MFKNRNAICVDVYWNRNSKNDKINLHVAIVIIGAEKEYFYQYSEIETLVVLRKDSRTFKSRKQQQSASWFPIRKSYLWRIDYMRRHCADERCPMTKSFSNHARTRIRNYDRYSVKYCFCPGTEIKPEYSLITLRLSAVVIDAKDDGDHVNRKHVTRVIFSLSLSLYSTSF